MSVTGSSSKGVAPIWNGDADATPDRKRAREQESDRSSSGSEDEEDGAAPGGRQQLASNTRKRRKNVLPVIKRNQRCGHCQTCLNPRVRALTCILSTSYLWNRSTVGTSSRWGQCWVNGGACCPSSCASSAPALPDLRVRAGNISASNGLCIFTAVQSQGRSLMPVGRPHRCIRILLTRYAVGIVRCNAACARIWHADVP